MTATQSLPPALAALAAPPTQALEPVTVRLSPDTIAAVEQLRERLNNHSRCAVLRALVALGLESSRQLLEVA